MRTLIANKVEIFSLPLGPKSQEGYDYFVQRVCIVREPGGAWTGVQLLDTVLTSGRFVHKKDFDIEYSNGYKTVGFLREDMDLLLELDLAKPPKVPKLTMLTCLPKKGDTVYCVGSFYGEPFLLARAVIDKFFEWDFNLSEERQASTDCQSAGSPVFHSSGAFLGLLQWYNSDSASLICHMMTYDGDKKFISV
jgi:hypothetical protein